jgi:preprotein translocase subunit SecA
VTAANAAAAAQSAAAQAIAGSGGAPAPVAPTQPVQPQAEPSPSPRPAPAAPAAQAPAPPVRAAAAPATPTAPEKPAEPEVPASFGRSEEPVLVAKGLDAPQRPQNLQYTAPSEDGSTTVAGDSRKARRALHGEASAAESDGRTFPGTPRNAQCPCGSGKKYKVCHGLNE